VGHGLDARHAGLLQQEPIHRKYHHDQLTFRSIYAFSENYTLPLSHDEVVHGKGSLLGKMPGDPWQRVANLRLLYGYMFATPGKKLLFMGGEFGQEREWDHGTSLDWHVLDHAAHAGLQRWVADVAQLYRDEPALHELDCRPEGFEWVDASDWEQSIVAFLRRAHSGETVLVMCNFTPVPRHNYRIGVPFAGYWREIANSDAEVYGGSGQGNYGGLHTTPAPSHGRPASLNLTLPPLGAVVLKGEPDEPLFLRAARDRGETPLTAPSGTTPERDRDAEARASGGPGDV
jgi:1,4-alpha-glucan branching enzyme